MFNWIKKLFKKEDILWQERDMIYPEYSFKVVRIKPYEGKLTVYWMDKIIYSKKVSITADAIYGLDIVDLEIWARTSVMVSDYHMGHMNSRVD